MRKQPVDPVFKAQAATKSIAILLILLCAGLWQEGHAQTRLETSRTRSEARHLQVQAVDVPAAGADVAVANSQRIALVIGNSAYKNAPLTNPVNDARAIALALKESGFIVIARENSDQHELTSFSVRGAENLAQR